MKHVLFGGNGFTGRELTRELVAAGANVLVCDMARGEYPANHKAGFHLVDVRNADAVATVPLCAGDVVYHLAARQYHYKVPRLGRERYFEEVNVAGTRNILAHALRSGCSGVIFFSTDMVYGFPENGQPVGREHPRNPLGPYGASKCKAEDLCRSFWAQGLNCTILRPRLIIGPGRLGVFKPLFRLIERGLPVPMIGDGSNRYQMVSVHDCVSAALAAFDKGVPNTAYNLGSKGPPTSRELLESLIHRSRSTSRLVSTPASLVKKLLRALDAVGLTVLYPEQFLIADLDYVVDTRATEQELGWRPRYADHDMIFEAYEDYNHARAASRR